MPTRYYIRLPNPASARGDDPDLAFRAHGAETFADELQHALREDGLFQRWRMKQEEPEEVDPALGATDPAASVIGTPDDLHVDLVAVTALPSAILRHRLAMLAGHGWELRDVTAA